MVAKACHPSHDQEVGDWLLPFSPNKELEDLILVARVMAGESLNSLERPEDRPGTAVFMAWSTGHLG